MPIEKTVPYTPITVPRDLVPLALFIQISLAIHTRPRAQPAMNRSANQTGTLGQTGMSSRMTAAKRIPETMQRLRPRRTMIRG